MKFFPSLACLIFTVASVAPANAQIVRIGPGGSVNVRAPFVRVYVGPSGETYVRAPFTEVVTPGYGYPVPQGYVVPPPQYFEPRVIESSIVEPNFVYEPEQVTEMNWQQLKRFLRASALQLDQDLDGEQAKFREPLLPDAIRDLAANDNNAPLDQGTVERLRSILAVYDEIAADESLRDITSLVSFQDVHQSLVEFLIAPQARLQRQMISSSQQLNQDLNRAVNGESLKTYLSVPAALVDESPESQPSAEQLDKVISNYEALNRTSQFRAVAQLSSFQATRQRLAEYKQLTVAKQVQSPPLEELELPPPKQ